MRQKTEQRRDLIIDTAEQVFYECGIEATSMSEIAKRVGGSKATLYNYFPGKDDLVIAMLNRRVERNLCTFLTHTTGEAGALVKSSLQAYAVQFSTWAMNRDNLRMWRMLQQYAQFRELGKRFYQNTHITMRAAIEQQLQVWTEQGQLKPADTRIMARHLLALIKAEHFDDALWVHIIPKKTDIQAAAQRAIEAFLAIYGKEI